MSGAKIKIFFLFLGTTASVVLISAFFYISSFSGLEKSSIINKQSSFEKSAEKDNNIYHLASSSNNNNDYKCIGTCICEEENDSMGKTIRSSSSSLLYGNNMLKKGLVFFVTGISSLVAINRAKEVFKEECKTKYFEEDCLSVKSEVDSCEKVVAKSSSSSSPSSSFSEEKAEKTIFFCKGNCIINGKLKREEAKEMSKEFGCERLRQEGEIELMIEKKKIGLKNKMAIQKFVVEYLTQYCKKNSNGGYMYERNNNARKFWVKVRFCVGSSKVPGGVRNPSVHCKQIFPKPRFSGHFKHWGEEEKKILSS